MIYYSQLSEFRFPNQGGFVYIKFNKLIFSNVLSFGATPTVVDFNSGLNLITGLNGSGKSAILDSLSFCLFGRPYRDVNLKDIINRKNKKNLYTECEFVKNGTDVYRIVRTMKPDSIKVFKGAQELDLLSSKKLNQDELDKIIGIDYDLFKQVIILAVNYNKPFITLTAGKKREIIEQIFKITVFGKMSVLNKKKRSDIKHQIDLNTRTSNMLESSLSDLKSRFIEIDSAKVSFEKDKRNNISDIESRIVEKNRMLCILKDSYENLINKHKNIVIDDITEVKKNRNDVNKKIAEIEYEIRSCKNKILKIENISICPECNTDISEEHRLQEIEKYRNIIISSQTELDSLKSSLETYLKIIKDVEANIIQENSLKSDISSDVNKINFIESDIRNLNERKTQLEASSFNVDIDSMRKDLLLKYDELKEIKKDGVELNDKSDTFIVASEILSEEGIKSFFFRNLVPMLNNQINDYLKLFEIPIMLKFDEYMNEKISSFTNINGEVPYLSYSEGEKKRIDMAIQLTFINITKTISDWNCNLLMIDELLDGAIDEYGLEKLVQSLKNMITESSSLCVYVISHRLKHEYGDMFSNRLQVNKHPNKFSIIT